MSERQAATTTLAGAVGIVFRLARERAGWSQDQAATAARLVGLGWTRAAIASLETGRRGLSADELLLLPLVLYDMDAEGLHGDGWHLADLVPDFTTVATPDGAQAVPGELLARLVSTGANRAVVEDIDRMRATAAERQLSAAITVAESADAERREAERHAADVLGVEVAVLVDAARGLWGHALTDERERRVSQRTAGRQLDRAGVRAVRGHVTRELFDELRTAMEDERP